MDEYPLHVHLCVRVLGYLHVHNVCAYVCPTPLCATYPNGSTSYMANPHMTVSLCMPLP